MDAEVGGMRPQAEEPLKPPGAGSGRKDSLFEPLEGARLCPHLEFGLLASGTVRTQMCVLLKLPSVQALVASATGN